MNPNYNIHTNLLHDLGQSDFSHCQQVHIIMVIKSLLLHNSDLHRIIDNFYDNTIKSIKDITFPILAEIAQEKIRCHPTIKLQ